MEVNIDYKYKKYYMNNKPFDEKVSIGANKAFRFLIEGRNSTMTVSTNSPSNPTKTYPNLYMPIYCLEPAVIDNIIVGIFSAPNMVFTYPIFVTSHTNSHIHIKTIELTSSSQAVELLPLPAQKLVIHSN